MRQSLSALEELQRNRVEAVALSRWRGPVVEYMTKVAGAALAADFDPSHAVAAVFDTGDVVCIEGRREAGPPSPGFEFRAGTKQRQAAQAAGVNPFLLVIQEETAERSFSAMLQENVALIGCEGLCEILNHCRGQRRDIVPGGGCLGMGSIGFLSLVSHFHLSHTARLTLVREVLGKRRS